MNLNNGYTIHILDIHYMDMDLNSYELVIVRLTCNHEKTKVEY